MIKNKKTYNKPTKQEIRNLLYQYQTEQFDFAEKIGIKYSGKKINISRKFTAMEKL